MSLSSVREAVESLGGREAVASLAEVTPGAVWLWEKNDTLPPDTRDLIDHECRLRGRKPLPRNLWRMKQHPELPRGSH
jgi:hypothetical protein